MGPNPLLPSEVRELASQLCFPLNAWLYELIYMLDDAVLGCFRGDQAAPAAKDKQHTDIPVDDVASLKAMVKARAATTRLIAEAKAQAKVAKAAKARPTQPPR